MVTIFKKAEIIYVIFYYILFLYIIVYVIYFFKYDTLIFKCDTWQREKYLENDISMSVYFPKQMDSDGRNLT